MAISKLYRIVEARANGNFMVKGFQSAKIILNITQGNIVFGSYGTALMREATYTDKRNPMYYDGRKINFNITLEEGVHEFLIDVSSLSYIHNAIIKSEDYIGEESISLFYEKLDVNISETDYVNQGDFKYIPLPLGAKQIDIDIEPDGDVDRGYYRIYGYSIDSEIWEEVTAISSLKENVSRAYIDAVKGVVNIYTNVEGYSCLKIHINTYNVKQRFRVEFKISNSYIDRDVHYVSNATFSKYISGYKYLTLNLGGVEVQNSGERIMFSPVDKNGEPISFETYNSNMELNDSYLSQDREKNVIARIYGKVAEGRVIIALSEAPHNPRIFSNNIGSIGSPVRNIFPMTISLSNTKPKKKEKEIFKEAKDYRIYNLPKTKMNKDVFHTDILKYSNEEIKYYMGGYDGIRYDILFNNENVPSLKDGEHILYAFLLPFDINNRSAGVGSYQTGLRISVFTNNGRIFHNFPARKTGELPFSDLFKFDESTVYNRFKSWLPVNDKSKVGSKTKYFPVLADYDYNQFDGRVEGTVGYVDHFNSGGLLHDSTFKLFDILKTEGNPFGRLTFGNMARDTKLSVFVNYNLAAGSEPIAIGTNDGGRIWHTKAYFACTDYYAHMRAGRIDFSPITDEVGAYVPNSLKINRKRFNIPTAEIKDPTTPFIVNEEDETLVTSMSVVDGTVQITTDKNVDYDGINPIIFFENVSANDEWDFICNNGFIANGTINNGIFFRAEKVEANKYNLFGDLGNPKEGDLVCRHLHAINRTQSGYLISTGESYTEDNYEGGFLYFYPQTGRNGLLPYNPHTYTKTLRLTSSKYGVNRVSGAYLFNDSGIDPTLLYVSDDIFAYSNKRNIKPEGRNIELPISPTGIYRGKLSDIDDLSKFECICETKQTLISLVEHMGNFAADGFGNELCISKGGKEWIMLTAETNKKINGTDQYGNIYFGDKMIEFK